MLSAKDLEKLVTEGTGRENRAPFVGLGSFEVTLKRMTMKRDKGQAVMVKGEVIEVPGKVLSYTIVGRVERSSNPKHPVGSDVAVYLGLNGKYEKQDMENCFEFAKALYACIGESIVVGVDSTDEQKKGAIEKINAVFGDPMTQAFDEEFVSGFRMLLETRLPKATDKEGNPKKKVPTEDGFLYKNWAPIQQSLQDVLARRAELSK